MLKRFIIVFLALAVVFGGIFWYKFHKIHIALQNYHNMPKPNQTITSVTARYFNWTPTTEAIGSLYAVNGIYLAAQRQGQVKDIYFKSGQMVKKGQRLVQLDDAPERATLKSLQATLEKLKFTYNRDKILYKQYDHGGLSELNLVTSRSAYLNAKASIDNQQQIINYMLIKAPFSGKIGIRQVNIGQYINLQVANKNDIATLQQINPLLVRFYLPAKELSKIKVGLPINISANAYPNETFKGNILAISSLIEPDTRMAYIEGRIANPDDKLLPGMFANVKVSLPTYKKVIVLPQTAVAYTSFGDTVYLIKKDGLDKKGKPILRAISTKVTVGEARDNRIIITQGVKSGDLIVSSGQNKLHSGIRVYINNSTPMK